MGLSRTASEMKSDDHTIFLPPPAKALPLEFCDGVETQNTGNMLLVECQKSLTLYLFV